METKKKQNVNSSTGEVITKRSRFSGQIFADPAKDDIITYKVIDEIVKTGEGKNDFKIVQKLVVAERVNRADAINAHATEVGLHNVLKRLALSGKDIASVVDSGAFYSKQKGFVDISKMPDNMVDAYKAVEKGVKEFDRLPNELKQKKSFDAFAQSVSEKDLSNYIAALSSALERKKAVKTEDKKGD